MDAGPAVKNQCGSVGFAAPSSLGGSQKLGTRPNGAGLFGQTQMDRCTNKPHCLGKDDARTINWFATSAIANASAHGKTLNHDDLSGKLISIANTPPSSTTRATTRGEGLKAQVLEMASVFNCNEEKSGIAQMM